VSKEHLWTALGRGRLDLDFSGKLLLDLMRTLRDAGLDLDSEETETLRQSLVPSPARPPGTNPFMSASMGPEDTEYQRLKMRERLDAQVARINELGAYTVSILKQTLDNARSAYYIITLMNKVMFFTGVALFAASAIYGAAFKDLTRSLLIGGLGAANFIALFLLGPINRTQNALSNLVQTEIAFLNYFEQLTFWEVYALAPRGNPPVPDLKNVARASEQLQIRTEETIELLERYVEHSVSGKKAKRS